MSRTKDLWQEQHEAAVERFVTGEDDRAAFTTNLQKLGFSARDINQEIDNASAERAEQAAYEAELTHYGRLVP
jgi:hypothetical protein